MTIEEFLNDRKYRNTVIAENCLVKINNLVHVVIYEKPVFETNVKNCVTIVFFILVIIFDRYIPLDVYL